MIQYSTNWMGPVSVQWFSERGFTEKKTTILTEESLLVKHGKAKVGDVYEYEDVVEHYSAGRIDVYGLDEKEYYGGMTELALPPMRTEDWNIFSDWLDTVETDDVWTLEQLVMIYERTNPKIRWAETPEWGNQ